MSITLLFFFLLTTYRHAEASSSLRSRASVRELATQHRSLEFFYNQNYRSRDLWKAIDEEDLDTFDTIMSCGCINVDEKEDGTDFTALHKAAQVKNYVMALALVEAGADVNAQDSIGNGPLHTSCFYHQINITKLLLDNGAEVNLRSNTNERPIIMAQTESDVPLLELLIRSGAEINFQDAEGETPLHEASAYGATENVRFLIERGADLSVKEQDGRTPAEFICACRDFDERRAATCFDGACGERDIRAIERVFREAERNRRTEDDAITVEDLWSAIVTGSVKRVNEILKNRNIELQAVTQEQTKDWDEGQSALHLAIVTGSIEICEILLESGSPADRRNAIGNTPLHLATESHSVPLVRLILSQNVSVDAQNDAGQTALHIASRNGLITVAQLLVSAGASRDLNDADGATAEEIFCTCRLEKTCPDGKCSSNEDVSQLMEVLNVTDSTLRDQYIRLYFQSTNADLEAVLMDRLPDEDDGASSLGLFIGLLFLFSFVFFVIYGIAVFRMQSKNRPHLTQTTNEPGPSNLPAHA